MLPLQASCETVYVWKERRGVDAKAKKLIEERLLSFRSDKVTLEPPILTQTLIKRAFHFDAGDKESLLRSNSGGHNARVILHRLCNRERRASAYRIRRFADGMKSPHMTINARMGCHGKIERGQRIECPIKEPCWKPVVLSQC